MFDSGVYAGTELIGPLDRCVQSQGKLLIPPVFRLTAHSTVDFHFLFSTLTKVNTFNMQPVEEDSKLWKDTFFQYFLFSLLCL